MNDFLSNLAAKNLNRVPIIQPQALSRFESAPAQHVMPRDPSLDQEPMEEAEFVESAAPRTAHATQPQHPIVPPGSIEPQPQTADVLQRPTSSPRSSERSS